MHTFELLGWVERSDIEIVQIRIFWLIKLGEFIVVCYDLSDTQDGLRCERNVICILWLTSSPCDKNSGERSRAHGLSCLNLNLQTIKLFEKYQ